MFRTSNLFSAAVIAFVLTACTALPPVESNAPPAEPTQAATIAVTMEATMSAASTPEAEPSPTTPIQSTPESLPPKRTPVNDDLGLAVPLSADLLKNSVYYAPSGYDREVPLVDGIFEDLSDPAMPVTVRLLEELIAFGDIDADGIDDAVVPLATTTGGTGVFVDIVLMSGRSGTATQIASVALGDRVVINGITATYGQFTVDMTTHGPSDPACCPTQEVVMTYVYQDGILAPIE